MIGPASHPFAEGHTDLPLGSFPVCSFDRAGYTALLYRSSTFGKLLSTSHYRPDTRAVLRPRDLWNLEKQIDIAGIWTGGFNARHARPSFFRRSYRL